MKSEFGVRSVAKRRFGAVFAATEEYFFAGLSSVFNRFKCGTFVRTITKGLPLRSTAGTPEIGLSLGHFDRIWRFLGDGRGV